MRTDPSTIFARELARVDEQRARNGGDVARDERLTRPWRPLEKDTRLQTRAVARERLGLAQRVNQHPARHPNHDNGAAAERRRQVGRFVSGRAAIVASDVRSVMLAV